MFLDEIRLLHVSPCSAAASRVRAVGRFSADISNVLPLLNGVVEHAVFDRARSSLTFRKGARHIVLSSIEVHISGAESTTDILKTVDWLKNLINDTWARRGHTGNPGLETCH